MKIFILFVSLFASFASGEVTETERADHVQRMLDEAQRRLTGVYDPANRWFAVFPEYFSAMPDDEVTRYLISWSYLKTGMDPFKDGKMIRLLRESPEILTDSTELRKIMMNETDPRRFFLQSGIARYFRGFHDENFVIERAHMLLKTGVVAHGYGEYTDPSFLDVSIGAYSSIVAELKDLGSDFVPPPETMPHEQRKMILARWLKANWPGCEELEIGGEARPERKPAVKSLPNEATRSTANGPSRVVRAEEGAMRAPWWALATGVLFAAAGGIYCWTRRSR